MTTQLLVIAGRDKGRIFPLAPGSALRIGRGATSQTKLVDLAVSRLHCEVRLHQGRAMVVDANSGGGTFVNGERVTSRELRHGDVIKIGATELRFDDDVANQKTVLATAGEPTTGAAAPEVVLANKPGAKILPKPVNDLQALAGKSLGSFQLRRVLGTGQIGVVFEAMDSKGKTVALKVLRADFARDAKARQRFVRGVKAERTLSHPNLVELYSAGIASPHCWISMELVDGDSLLHILEQIANHGQRDWKATLRCAVHVARGLQAVHEHGVVHRNVTPPNILVRRADLTAKLGDALLAKNLETTASDEVSSSNEFVGNIYYMAPERTQQGVTIDGRSDLYSLGATLYHFITGRLPFEGTSMAEVITMIQQALPEPIRQFNSKIPDRFVKVVDRLLAKEPEQRYSSARELVVELEEIAKTNRV